MDPDRAAELARVAAHPQGPQRKLKANENDIFNGTLLLSVQNTFTDTFFTPVETQGEPGAQEIRNERALFVFHRVQHKLTGPFFLEFRCQLDADSTTIGRDFNPEITLSIRDQVEKLIDSATALENLCQCFSGWCAFW